MRNPNNYIVGITLVKKFIETDNKYKSYPSSPFPKSEKNTTLQIRNHYSYNYMSFWNKPPTEFTPRRVWIKSLDRKYFENNYQVYQVIFTLISPKFRGKNYNQILLDYVYDKAIKNNNCNKIIAHIRESNTPSLKSFIKNGYRFSKKYTKPYKNGEKKIRVYKNTIEFKEKIVEDDTITKLNQIINDYKKKKTKRRIKSLLQLGNQHQDVPCS
jgi:RimJ/RimL family protein N-acetyltransferase